MDVALSYDDVETGGQMRPRHYRFGWMTALSLTALVVLGLAALLINGSVSVASASPPGITTPTTAGALELAQTTPSPSTTEVSPSGPFQLAFNQPVKASAMSHLQTSVAGKWRSVGSDTIEFIPAQTLLPDTTVTIKSPSSLAAGPIATNGATLAKPIDLSWTSEGGSVLRLQQVLASLGYLPLRWTPRVSQTSLSPVQQLYSPVSGAFSPRYPSTPASLQSSFQPGVDNRMTQGAVVAFERSNGMPAYTSIRPQLWPALLNAEASGLTNTNGYSYTTVSKTIPETITIWHDGSVVLHTLVNTGLPQTPTPDGTFFVYLRYPTQTMTGTNINGSYYVDHGVKWVNYIDGSVAIHGFVRTSYGFPQSLGCIELPVSQAARAWKWLHYGSLVSIS